MDENGACKFPADRLAEVYKNVQELAKNEAESMKNISALKSAERCIGYVEITLKLKLKIIVGQPLEIIINV